MILLSVLDKMVCGIDSTSDSTSDSATDYWYTIILSVHVCCCLHWMLSEYIRKQGMCSLQNRVNT